jgi:glycogen debranching enzyme
LKGSLCVASILSYKALRERAASIFREDITILNHADEGVDLEVRLEVGADFADLFEIKDALTKKGNYYHRIEDGRLVLGYRRGGFTRETAIVSGNSAAMDEHGLRFTMHIEPHGEWTTGIDVILSSLGIEGQSANEQQSERQKSDEPGMQQNLQRWLKAAPLLSCDWKPMEQIYQRSLVDLAALRFSTKMLPGYALPAAGLPWFMTIFGRDSILTSLQALPYNYLAGA